MTACASNLSELNHELLDDPIMITFSEMHSLSSSMSTIHRTFSEHGGVVREPSYETHLLGVRIISSSAFAFLTKKQN